MKDANLCSKVGATFYLLWALLQLYVAYKLLMMGGGLEVPEVGARISQLAAYIGAAGLFVAAFSFDNWRNTKLGYWANLAIVSAFDIGYILFVVLVIDMPFIEAWLGPALWLLALLFSSLGYFFSSEIWDL